MSVWGFGCTHIHTLSRFFSCWHTEYRFSKAFRSIWDDSPRDSGHFGRDTWLRKSHLAMIPPFYFEQLAAFGFRWRDRERSVLQKYNVRTFLLLLCFHGCTMAMFDGKKGFSSKVVQRKLWADMGKELVDWLAIDNDTLARVSSIESAIHMWLRDVHSNVCGIGSTRVRRLRIRDASSYLSILGHS